MLELKNRPKNQNTIWSTGNSILPSTGKDVCHNPSKRWKIFKYRSIRLLQRPNPAKGCDRDDQCTRPAKREEVGKHNLRGWEWLAGFINLIVVAMIDPEFFQKFNEVICSIVEVSNNKIIKTHAWTNSIYNPTFPRAGCSKRLIDIDHIQCLRKPIALMFQHSFSKKKHI